MCHEDKCYIIEFFHIIGVSNSALMARIATVIDFIIVSFSVSYSVGNQRFLHASRYFVNLLRFIARYFNS